MGGCQAQYLQHIHHVIETRPQAGLTEEVIEILKDMGTRADSIATKLRALPPPLEVSQPAPCSVKIPATSVQSIDQ